MNQSEIPTIPVVVAGKDRTRMTCAVVDFLTSHIKGAAPRFYCVSDRSRDGHDEVVSAHLRDSGQHGYRILRTRPEKGRSGWGAAINIGLEAAFTDMSSECALVVDNDWLLQQDLDISKYLYAFDSSAIGAITFKHVNEGTFVQLADMALGDGSTYMLRMKKVGDRFSFTAELGCMLITRRMYESYGKFKENSTTDETEIDFCMWYNHLTTDEKNAGRMWFATDKALFHTDLNGEGHVFTHVGLVSQHEGPHRWKVPEEYHYLSDDKEDERVCKSAVQKIRADENTIADENTVIPWEKYFDRVFVMAKLDSDNIRLPRLRKELKRVGLINSPILEWRYGVNTKLEDSILHDEGWDVNVDEYKLYCIQYLKAIKESLLLGYNRIMVIEDDIAFLRNKRELNRRLANLPDAPAVQLDKFIWQQYEYDILKKEAENGEYFTTDVCFTSSTCNVFNRAGMQKLCEMIEHYKFCTDHLGKFFGKECAIAVKNLAIQVFYADSQGFKRAHPLAMHKCYMNQGIDENYSEYAVPRGYKNGSIYTPMKRKGRKFVSVYAIAKNEAENARRWFECVQEADEVCVLDTGSTDDTVKILRELGAKVEVKTYEEWSFGVARNDSLEMTSPDAEIVFTLDLDETIEKGWRKKLEDAWISEEKKGTKPVGMLYKYIWSYNPDGSEAQSFSVMKVHARDAGTWRYRCHEILYGINGHIFFLEGFVVGHHQNKATDRSKYIQLLEKDAREMPDNDRCAYYYARELMYAGRWVESIDEFKHHLSLKSACWAAERASCMRSIANCYKHLGNEDMCELWLWKSAEEDPKNREATYCLGEIFMEREDYRSAVKVLKRCVAIDKPSLEYISTPIVWSARPWYIYSQALWWTGHWDDAVEACKKALEVEPKNAEVANQLDGMMKTKDKFKDGKAK